MKSFIQLLCTALVCIALFSTIIYTGCKDKCGGTVCQNGGTCSDNICVCPQGSSGNACQTTWSTVFIGTYSCSQVCKPAISGAANWTSPITTNASNGTYTVNIANFAGGTTTQVATVDSNGGINITPAVGTSGITATGSINSSDDTIVLVYKTVDIGSGTSGSTCTITMGKL